jgi:hypothetical protein
MSWADFQAAVRLIESHPEMKHFMGPRDDELIARAEDKLGLIIPAMYREFLRRYGAGNFGACEIYGITVDNFETGMVPNGIWLTIDERASSRLPPNLILIMSLDYEGAYAALDTAAYTAGEEAPVVSWIPGLSNPSEELTIIAEDFGAILLEGVQTAIDIANQK